MNFIFYIFLTITLFVNFSNAKEIKSSKDTNKTMSDEEFMKQWEQLEKEKKEAIDKEANSRADLEATKKRRKDLDEILNKLKINQK